MKKMILLAAMAVLGLQAQAQIVSSRSSMTTRQVINEPKTNTGWSTFGLEYLPSNFSSDGHSESFSGFAVNYTNAISVTQSAPVFLEWGLGAQYSRWSEGDETIHYASVKVPLNVIYDFAIPSTNINLDPYVGLKFRVNAWGELKDDYYDESWNLFDKDEGDWNRFQIGMQFGVKARFNNKFFLGVGYGFDFSEICDDTKVNEVSLSLGLVF